MSFSQSIPSANTHPTSEWEIGPKYRFAKLLGYGSYGSVCLAASAREYVAIKKFASIFSDPVRCKRVLREIELLYSMNSQHVVKPLDVFMRQGSDIYLVMEIGQADLSTLGRLVHLEEKQVKGIMYGILVALNYLHSGGVIHRDVKPGNILVNQDCSVKLCDFSLGRSISGLNSSCFDCGLMLRKHPSLKSAEDSDEDVCEEMDEGKKATPKISQYKFQGGFEKSRARESSREETKSSPELKDTIEAKKKDQRTILLTSSKAYNPVHTRELSGHIATRWYRPPEIILLEKVYTTSVDMWGAGCVFAELLEMIPQNQPDISKRSALFPGESCFPLSPSKSPSERVLGMPTSPQDQLRVILGVLGEPSAGDLSFLNDQRAEDYVKALAKVQAKVKLTHKLPAASQDAVDLLRKLLSFNPYYRITAREALGHRYFADVRNKKQEVEMPHLVQLITDTEKSSSLQVLANAVLKKVLSGKSS